MSLQKIEPNSSHWSNYWSEGPITSLPQDFKTNYDGEISSFWSAQFAKLGQQPRILDVCCGNGAIAFLAAKHSQKFEKKFEIHGVDAAVLNVGTVGTKYPGYDELLDMVTFHENSPIETFDSKSNSFDLIVSQYGIEYCDWKRAARKIGDLLDKDGRFVFISHSVNSDILKYMNEEAKEYQFFASPEFFGSLESYSHDQLGFVEFQSFVNTAIHKFDLAQNFSNSQLLSSVYSMLKQAKQMDFESLEKYYDHLLGYYQQLEQGYARLNDMLRVNTAILENPKWFEVFEKNGLVLVNEGDIYYDQQHHAGHYCIFEKA